MLPGAVAFVAGKAPRELRGPQGGITPGPIAALTAEEQERTAGPRWLIVGLAGVTSPSP